jgi:DNA-binding NtrC family response regulator
MSKQQGMTEQILVVDDDEAVGETIKKVLRSAGYRCHVVTDGVQALELLESGDEFDLVTSDIKNTPWNGIELLERLKSGLSALPVLVISGVCDISVASACIQKGACGYVLKPFKREELLHPVDRALKFRSLLKKSDNR